MDLYKIYLMLSSDIKQMDLKTIKRLALASQILKLSGLKINYDGKEKIVLKDHGQYTVEIQGKGDVVKYLITKPDQQTLWLPRIEVRGFKEFLQELDLITVSPKEHLIYNPLPISVPLIYNNAFYMMQPFSIYKYEAKEAIGISDSSKVFRIKGSSFLAIHEDYIKVCMGSNCFYIYGITSVKSVKRINSSLLLNNSNIRLIISLVEPFIYVDVHGCIDLCMDWLNAAAYFLTPYYLYHDIIDLVDGDTYYNGLLGLKNSFFISIANPYLKSIEVKNSRIRLCNSKYMIYYSLHPSYKDLFSQLLSSIMSQEKLVINGIKPSLRISDLIYYYPHSILLAEYLFDHGNIGLVLVNPFNSAIKTTIYSLLPIKDPFIYTASIVEGYKPAFLKPNMISFTIKPYAIVIVKFRLGLIDRETLAIRSVWRKMGKKSEY